VMGIDRDFATAFGKSQIGAGTPLPTHGTVFVSVRDRDKPRVIAPLKDLQGMGFRIIATRGTRRHLEANGVACEVINKVLEGRPHIVDAMKNGDVALVFNTTEGAKALSDSKDIRRTALLNHIPYYTTLAGAVAVTKAIAALRAGSVQVAPLQSYTAKRTA
jgi:carbamoyl-phosphate synthase large subunit